MPTRMSSRLDAMDAQRYDLSKRHSHSTFSLMTQAASADSEVVHPWTDFTSTSYNSSALSESGEHSTLNDSENLSNSPFCYESLLSDGSMNMTDCEEDEDKKEYAATCMIIRPVARLPIRGFFSRSSSPISRPTSPIIFRTLNCFGGSEVFEDEVDYLQTKRADELHGTGGVRVFVTQVQEVRTEESWRGAIQEMLYGNEKLGGTYGVPAASRGD